MILGGFLTFAFTGLAVNRIPALCTYRDDVGGARLPRSTCCCGDVCPPTKCPRSAAGHDMLAASDEEASSRESIALMERLETEENDMIEGVGPLESASQDGTGKAETAGE